MRPAALGLELVRGDDRDEVLAGVRRLGIRHVCLQPWQGSSRTMGRAHLPQRARKTTRSAGQLFGAPIGGGHRRPQHWGQTICPHQHPQRRFGGAAGTGHIAAERRRRSWIRRQ